MIMLQQPLYVLMEVLDLIVILHVAQIASADVQYLVSVWVGGCTSNPRQQAIANLGMLVLDVLIRV